MRPTKKRLSLKDRNREWKVKGGKRKADRLAKIAYLSSREREREREGEGRYHV
jgi:hypothetical protein